MKNNKLSLLALPLLLATLSACGGNNPSSVLPSSSSTQSSSVLPSSSSEESSSSTIGTFEPECVIPMQKVKCTYTFDNGYGESCVVTVYKNGDNWGRVEQIGNKYIYSYFLKDTDDYKTYIYTSNEGPVTGDVSWEPSGTTQNENVVKMYILSYLYGFTGYNYYSVSREQITIKARLSADPIGDLVCYTSKYVYSSGSTVWFLNDAVSEGTGVKLILKRTIGSQTALVTEVNAVDTTFPHNVPTL